jgi:5,10-methylenetetrahydrofolate reductase
LNPPSGDKPFLRAVEVFPPTFPAIGRGDAPIDLQRGQGEFVEGVRRIAGFADYFLVADLKDPSLLKVSSLHSAALLRSQLGVRAVPVIVARDANRSSVTSSILTSFSLGLDSVFLVWGDDYSGPPEPKNVFDFKSLTDVIRLTRALAMRAGVRVTIFAPIDLAESSADGIERGRRRLEAGADFLLAQPPTTDSDATFRSHLGELADRGIRARVLINIFPFRDAEDARVCAEKFRWSLPARVMEVAERGEGALLREERRIALLAKQWGMGGVYVSTRGKPSAAAAILR